MAAGNVHVTVDARELHRLLRQLAVRGGDAKPWFRAYLDKAVSRLLKGNFDTRGGWSGRWAPLRPVTRIARVRRGGNRGGVNHPLWDTGRLRGSLIRPSHPEAVRVIGRLRYERGTAVPYARYHQRGFTVRKWGRAVFRHSRKVPARVIVPDPPPWMLRAWERSLAAYVKGRVV